MEIKNRVFTPGELEIIALANAMEERLVKALEMIRECRSYDHKQWVLDQVVRILTGCQTVTKEAVDYKGDKYQYEGLGDNEAYFNWVSSLDEWDEGIAP